MHAATARLLVTPGGGLKGRCFCIKLACNSLMEQARTAIYFRLKPCPQPAFDEMLWASDLNLVRGEDSLVRALWAGQPLVWQIYLQHDDAHHAKLAAFLDWLQAPASPRRWHAL